MFQVNLLNPLWLSFSINQAFNRDISKQLSNDFSEDIQDRFTRVRDRCFTLIKKSNTDFPAYHIQKRPGQFDPADGISVYEVGYTRLIRDEARGIDVDVFSAEITPLLRTKGENSILEKVLDDPDIYILGAYDASQSKKVKRERREQRLKELRQELLYNQQFYIEATPLDEDDLDGEWGFRVANGAIAFGMRPTSQGKWLIWARPNLNGDVDDFVRLPKSMPEGKRFSFFEEGQLEAKSFETAFSTVQQLCCKAALNHRRGIPDLVPMTPHEDKTYLGQNLKVPMRKKIQSAAKIWNETVTRQYVRGLGVGASVGSALTAVEAIVTGNINNLAQNLFIGLGTGVIITQLLEVPLNRQYSALVEDLDKKRLEAKKDITERDFSDLYYAGNEDNKGRFLKKANPEAIRYLKALSAKEGSLSPDSFAAYPETHIYSDDPKLKEIGLLNMVKRIYGSVIARPGMMNMMWAFYPNGGVGIRHVEDKKDGDTKVTATYWRNVDNVSSRKAPLDMIAGIDGNQIEKIIYETQHFSKDREQKEQKAGRPLNGASLINTRTTKGHATRTWRSLVQIEAKRLNIADLGAQFADAVDPFCAPDVLKVVMIETERARRKADLAKSSVPGIESETLESTAS